VPYNADVWSEHLAFRDYLRTHSEKVKIYSEIKKEAVSLEKNNLLSYHEHKDALVKRLLLEALEWKQHV